MSGGIVGTLATWALTHQCGDGKMTDSSSTSPETREEYSRILGYLYLDEKMNPVGFKAVFPRMDGGFDTGKPEYSLSSKDRSMPSGSGGQDTQQSVSSARALEILDKYGHMQIVTLISMLRERVGVQYYPNCTSVSMQMQLEHLAKWLDDYDYLVSKSET